MLRFAALSALVCAFSIIVNSPLLARNPNDGIEGQLGQNVYRYFLPADYNESREYPLVLYLHGAGQAGSNNDNQLGLIGGMIDRTESEFPAILVAPQLPNRVGGWSPSNAIDRTSEILAQLVDTLSVDTNRLYLTGISMGGFGAMEYAQRYNAEGFSDLRFAAVAPLAGSFLDTSRPGVPENLSDTPFWLAHGSRDTSVDINTSRRTFRTLAGLGTADPIPFGDDLLGGPTAIVGNVRYTEVAGARHNISAPVYNGTMLYEWMFSQSLAIPEPNSVLLAVLAGFSLLGQRPLRLR